MGNKIPTRQKKDLYTGRRGLLKATSGAIMCPILGHIGSDTATASSGDIIWEFTEPSGLINSSPTVVDGIIYAGSHDETLYAVDISSGEQKWRFTEPSGLINSSPTVVDETVFVGSNDETLYAIDTVTGDKVWEFSEASTPIISSPTVVAGTVYVSSFDGTIYAVDAATGEQEWRSTEPTDWVFSSPTVVDETVYVSSHDETLYAVDAATGDSVWEFTEPTESINSSPTVADGTVFVGSNDETLYAVNTQTGEQEWRFTEPTDSVISSPTVADGTVFVGSNDETLYAVDAATGDKVWEFTEAIDAIDTSPTVVESTVYTGSRDGTVYAVDTSTGDLEWTFNGSSEPITTSLIVASGTLYVGSGYIERDDDENVVETDGTLYAVDAAVSESSEGSRASLGTHGHHDNWRYAGQTIRSANIIVESIETTTPIKEGESFDVTAVVSNTGRKRGSQTLLFEVENVGTESEEVILDSGKSVEKTVSFDSKRGDVGEYNVTVDSENDSASQTVVISESTAGIGNSNDEAPSETDSNTFVGTDSMIIAGSGGMITLLGGYVLFRRFNSEQFNQNQRNQNGNQITSDGKSASELSSEPPDVAPSSSKKEISTENQGSNSDQIQRELRTQLDSLRTELETVEGFVLSAEYSNAKSKNEEVKKELAALKQNASQHSLDGLETQIREVERECSKQLSRSSLRSLLQEIDPYEFERLVAKIWEKRGWKTQVTSGSTDRGVDVIATKEDAFEKRRHLIQAKRYGESTTVGSTDIQRYASLYTRNEQVDQVFVVTSSDFTREAEQVAKNRNVNIITGSEFIEMLKNT